MTTIKLSKRNLLVLLHKLTVPDSSCSIIKYITDDNGSEHAILLVVEHDETHYNGREPGEMLPESEEFASWLSTQIKMYVERN